MLALRADGRAARARRRRSLVAFKPLDPPGKYATRREWAAGVPPTRRGPMDSRELLPFNISIRGGYGAVVLHIDGEFDMDEVETFRSCVDEIITSCDTAVVVDLAGVTFIDTSAISALQNTRRASPGRAVSFVSSISARRLHDSSNSPASPDLVGDTVSTPLALNRPSNRDGARHGRRLSAPAFAVPAHRLASARPPVRAGAVSARLGHPAGMVRQSAGALRALSLRPCSAHVTVSRWGRRAKQRRWPATPGKRPVK